MKDVAIERARKHHKCPYCNNEVSTVKLGELFGNKAKEFVDIVKYEKYPFIAYAVYDGKYSFDNILAYDAKTFIRRFNMKVNLEDITKV